MCSSYFTLTYARQWLIISHNDCLDVYYLAFPKDRTVIKSLVYGVYVIQTVQTILVTHDAFNGYAKGYGRATVLNSAQLEWLAVPIFSGIGMF